MGTAIRQGCVHDHCHKAQFLMMTGNSFLSHTGVGETNRDTISCNGWIIRQLHKPSRGNSDSVKIRNYRQGVHDYHCDPT